MRRATRASLAVALSLLGLKVGAWHVTGSVAMLASAVDSLLDGLASFVALLAVHASLEPPDDEHRFGHGKLEPLAALAQSLLVLASALGLVKSAIERLAHPQAVEQGALGLAVLAVSSVATLWLVRFQRKVVAATESTAVAADALHYATDLALNAAVALALVGSWGLGWLWLDPALGLVAAVLVGKSALQIGWDAVQLLMDRELPDADREKILTILRAHPEVHGVHDLRTRRSGLHKYVQFHLEMDGELPLKLAYVVGKQVEAEVMTALPGAEVIVRFDPGDDRV